MKTGNLPQGNSVTVQADNLDLPQQTSKYSADIDGSRGGLELEKPQLLALMAEAGYIPQDIDEVQAQAEIERQESLNFTQEGLWSDVRDRLSETGQGHEIVLSAEEADRSRELLDSWTPTVYKVVIDEIPGYDGKLARHGLVGNPVNADSGQAAVDNAPEDIAPGDLAMVNLNKDTQPLCNFRHLEGDPYDTVPRGRMLSMYESAESLYQQVTEETGGETILRTPGADDLVVEDEEGVTDEALLLAAEDTSASPGLVELFYDPEEGFPAEDVREARENVQGLDIGMDEETERALMYLSGDNLTGAAEASYVGSGAMDLANFRGRVHVDDTPGEPGQYIVGIDGAHDRELLGKIEKSE